MGRLFEEHHIRKTKSLDGSWKFACDPSDCGKNEEWYNGIPDGETVVVPSVWNTQQGLLTYEGVCWYEKEFYTDGGCLRLSFGAVMTEGEVWFDGKYLGLHYGGFTQFDFIIDNVRPAMHHISVRVDNRFDAQSVPQTWVDWYHYGGIPRSVCLETLNGVSILSDKIDYELSDNLKSAKIWLTLDLFNADSNKTKSKITVSFGDNTVYTGEVTLEPKENKTINIPEFEFDNIRLWDVDTPNLYSVVITSDTDDLRDRVGFRRVCVENEKILLNGKEIEIRGVNRHEEHPDFGFAFPANLMKKDIDLALDMGCNSIRGSHYPNSKEFVDFLDERGILFWSEIPVWGVGFSEEALADPVVVERGLNMHREMVKQYYNHPSIIIWGMHNEILSNTQPAYNMSKIYYEFLKEKGGNRLVVYASHKLLEDICFEFTDVICLNQYLGWYGEDMYAWEDFVNKFIEKRNELGFFDKPVIFSEFGAAALYGCHDDEDILWSEEYQAKLLSHCIRLFHAHPSVVGFYVWQFCDIRTCKDAGINRARGFNNKGVLNEHRKPKLAFKAVENLYKEFASNK
jgi:beta-glucuronidase